MSQENINGIRHSSLRHTLLLKRDGFDETLMRQDLLHVKDSIYDL